MNKYLHFNINLHPGNSLRFRRKWQSRTVAAQPLPASDVKLLASQFLQKDSASDLTVTLNVGITFLSFKDRYTKSVGRAEADKRMAPTVLNVVAVTINQTHVFVHLASYKGVNLVLRANKTTGFSSVVGDIDGR